ncbi:hypothetical protein PR202_gb03955 [Eleusine coracana subsp. coracana]|uniref:Uncharacterized protein n=1 Tax=Eleusine coracana subsp. coracana TaxID=191504 RepID=A0AAV5E2H7_ELECO|nr:hypothetical protein PR202_gb03955 [Eleusine coracana subsp. coracana]
MDTGWLHHPGASASADADTASSSAASCGSASRASRLRKGIRLRLRRRRQEPALTAKAGGTSSSSSSAAGVQDDLALPLGMSFAAVLAQNELHALIVGCEYEEPFQGNITTCSPFQDLYLGSKGITEKRKPSALYCAELCLYNIPDASFT